MVRSGLGPMLGSGLRPSQGQGQVGGRGRGVTGGRGRGRVTSELEQRLGAGSAQGWGSVGSQTTRSLLYRLSSRRRE